MRGERECVNGGGRKKKRVVGGGRKKSFKEGGRVVMNNQSGKIPNQTKVPMALLPKSTFEPRLVSTPSNCPFCPFDWGCSQQHLALPSNPSGITVFLTRGWFGELKPYQIPKLPALSWKLEFVRTHWRQMQSWGHD